MVSNQATRIDIQGVRLDIDEHRDGVEVADDFRRGRERVGRGQDEVASLQTDRLERQMHRGGTGIDGDRKLCADVAGKLPFKLVGLGRRS